MINASNAFKQELFNDNRDYAEYVDITLDGGGKTLNLKNSDLWGGGLTIEDAVSSDNTFSIGAAIINKCTVVINNIYETYSEYDFGRAEVVPYVGLKLPDGTTERIRKGTFIVDEAKYNGSIITLSCLDNMSKFDKEYSESNLKYPATLNQIVRDACDRCDVQLQTYNFPHDSFVVQARPEEKATTFREIISWCAQIAGCFCRCDTLGRLELKWYDQRTLEKEGLDGGIFDTANQNQYITGDSADGGSFSPWNIGDERDGGEFRDRRGAHYIYSLYSMNISVDDVVITGVRIAEKNKEENKDSITTYQSGTDGYVISIENNQLIKGGAAKEIVGWLGEQLIGFRFRKGEFSHSSDPTIEAGDVGFLIDRKQNVYPIPITSTKFSTGGNQTSKASAQNPARNSAARFSAETKNYVDYRKDIEKERTDREKALEELKKRVDNSSGLFTTSVEQPDGSNIFYMHDKPTLSESMIVWKMTAEAFAVSTDGGESYNAGLTVDGDLIVRILTAVGVNADWVKTGAFRIEKNGKTMVNMDFDTGVVDMVVDTFSLSSGKTINSIAREEAKSVAKEEAEKAVDAQTQEDIFNKLTNDGAISGIFMQNNQLYINGTYISTGILKDSNGNVKWNLSTGEMSAKELSIDSTYFKLSKVGRVQATGGAIKKSYFEDVMVVQDAYNPDIANGNWIGIGNQGILWHKGSGNSGYNLRIATDESEAEFALFNPNNLVFRRMDTNTNFLRYSKSDDEFTINANVKIPNNKNVNIFTPVDMHNWEIKNAKIRDLAGINGITPFTGQIKVLSSTSGAWGTFTVNDGIITSAHSSIIYP